MREKDFSQTKKQHALADLLLAGAAVLLLVISTIYIVRGWNGFDGKIPSEYSFWGKADINFAGYGNRKPLVVNLAAGWICFLLLSALALRPQIWNLGAALPEKAEPECTVWIRHILLVFSAASSVHFTSYLFCASRDKNQFILMNLLLIIAMTGMFVLGLIMIDRAIRKTEK